MNSRQVPQGLIEITSEGLYCAPADLHIDPWRPVRRAVITHAHGDHARPGSTKYLTSEQGLSVLRIRLGPDAAIQTARYGERLQIGEVTVSLHPAGHILGSSQVRLEHRGEVWVVSGDYKLEEDRTCAAFEPVKCHTFVTESTFGLPVYQWPDPSSVGREINDWWRQNREQGQSSLLFAYSLGKAQRILAGLDESLGPVFLHGAIEPLTGAYRQSGVALPPARLVADAPRGINWHEAFVIAPPSAQGTPWMRRFGEVSSGFASGWMLIRGTRRRRAVDRGFVLSDHADWKGLLTAIHETGAQRVFVTHGYTGVLVRFLRGKGLEAWELETRFEGEVEESAGE